MIPSKKITLVQVFLRFHLICPFAQVFIRPGKRVIWVGYESGRSSGRVALGSVMVGSGSVRVSGQIRVNHVRVGFGFGSVRVWVGYISGDLR